MMLSLVAVRLGEGAGSDEPEAPPRALAWRLPRRAVSVAGDAVAEDLPVPVPVILGIFVGVSFVMLFDTETPRDEGGAMLLSLREPWELVVPVPTEGEPAIVGS